MEFEAYDEATISQKLLPIFDDVFLQKLQEKESRIITLLSRHLAQIILQSSQKDLPALCRSLQSVISQAISKEIAENKDKMVDALYPIMGGMISKYVTQSIKEMMEHINEKIEDGLSLGRYRRKLKSKMTGVSETELLIKESNDAHISSLFVIHKESGLLIAEARVKDQEIDDPHMVASMASAIKDFVNDWIKNHEDAISSEVQIVSYGNETLYIESAGSVYIIAFLDAEPDHEQRADINAFFATLIKEYSTFFQNFDGDDSSKEIETISQKMHAFLDTQRDGCKLDIKKQVTDKKEKNPAKIIIIILSMTILGYLLYLGSQYYTMRHLEKRILEQTNQHIEIKCINGKIHIEGNVPSMHEVYTIENIVLKETGEDFVNALRIPLDKIDQRLSRQLHIIKKFEDALLRQAHTLSRSKKNFVAQVSILQQKIKELKKHSSALESRYDTLEKYIARTEKALLRKNKEIKELEDTLQRKISTLQQNIKLIKEDSSAFASQYDKLQKRFIDTENIAWTKAYALEKLAREFRGDSTLSSADGSLNFKNRGLFKIGETVPQTEALRLLEKNFRKYIEALMGDKKIASFMKEIVIEGYTDSSGNNMLNKKLSEQRAWNIKVYLSKLDISKKFHLGDILKAQGLGNTNLVIIEGKEDQEASRRIRIKFELNQKKLLHAIKRSLYD